MQFKQKEVFHLIEKNKQELWQQRISDWEQSGMEIRAWCSKNHIEEQQFHYYKRQLKHKQDTSQVPMFAEVSLGSGSSAFPTRTASVENRLTLYVQWIKLVIPDDFQPETLLSFLRVIKQL